MLSEKDWLVFGRWMMLVSGIVVISLGLYRGDDLVSWLLRIWGVAFGVYCIYLGIFQ